jgi:hypothetical protein
MSDSDTTPSRDLTRESVHEEIEDIHEYVDQIPVVKKSLRKEPRLIAVVGRDSSRHELVDQLSSVESTAISIRERVSEYAFVGAVALVSLALVMVGVAGLLLLMIAAV